MVSPRFGPAAGPELVEVAVWLADEWSSWRRTFRFFGMLAMCLAKSSARFPFDWSSVAKRHPPSVFTKTMTRYCDDVTGDNVAAQSP